MTVPLLRRLVLALSSVVLRKRHLADICSRYCSRSSSAIEQKHMCSSVNRALIAFLGMTALATSAHADLVGLDLNSAGDALVTLDTVTGLKWLDLSQTASVSYNEIIADTHGWGARGYRFATRAEVEQLFRNAGVSTVDWLTTADNAQGVQNLIEQLGWNSEGGNFRGGAGMLSDESLNAQGRIGLASYAMQVFGGGAYAGADAWEDKLSFGDVRGANISSFLVSPVPLPASAWLLLSGIGLLRAAARRRSVPLGSSSP